MSRPCSIPVGVLHDGENANFDVIFFPGLPIPGDGDALNPWPGGENGKICWPAKWLPEDLGNIRVLNMSYDVKDLGPNSRWNVADIGENLTQVLSLHSIGSRPFVMVGHSLGGLVVKSLLSEMDRLSHKHSTNDLDTKAIIDAKGFLKNLRGIVFYATPHSGCDTDSLLLNLPGESGISLDLQPLQEHMRKLSTTAMNAFRNRDVNVYAFTEGKPPVDQAKVVVPHASAVDLAGDHHFNLEDCDHFGVCKPPSKAHMSYAILLEFLKICDVGRELSPCSRFGLKESLSTVIGKLDSGHGGIVGLYGMGGIGKTTLARAVYDHYYRDFPHRIFLDDVREREAFASKKEFMRGLLGTEVSDTEYGAAYYRLKDLKVLVVIDNIDDKKQFQDLILDMNMLGKGSRVIVTSRDRGLLSQVLVPYKDLGTDVEKIVLHEVEGLNSVEAQKLFNFHAFSSVSPPRGFEDLAERVALACDGLPLALEVIGSLLRDKKDLDDDKDIWLEVLEMLTKEKDIQSKLKISYDKGLSVTQKLMFLDISCLLLGEHKEVAMDIWASCRACSCALSGGVKDDIRVLEGKCLVKLDMDGRLRMHDVLRDMGRVIVEDVLEGDYWNRSHLWGARAESCFRNCEGTNLIRGFSRPRQYSEGDTSVPTGDAMLFAKMGELHLLVLDGCYVTGDFSKWPEELRWLRWRNFPFPELPAQLSLIKIAVLDLSGSNNLRRIWADKAPNKVRSEFRRLILNFCIALEELPQNIGTRLPLLRVLDLHSCVMLESLPDSIGAMRHLEHLILKDCRKLRSIPATVGGLRKLKHLDVSGCSNLESLPDALVNLSTLEQLVVVGCDELQRLPMDFRNLTNLKVLKLHSCKELGVALYIGRLTKLGLLHLNLKKLKRLPNDLGQLTGLTEMCLDDCIELESVPDVGSLVLLKSLSLKNTHRLESLPESLGNLKGLTSLVLQRCDLITDLPKSFADLSSLVRLQVNLCPELRAVKALPRSLQHLDLGNCPKLGNLPSFEEMTSLATLILCSCTGLTEIQGLGRLNALEEVNLTGCTSLPPNQAPLAHSRAMRSCCLSGSNVAVKYDSDWSQSEPALQLISYYDDGFQFMEDGPLINSIVSVEYCHKVFMEATVVGEKECVAVVICCVAHDQGWSDYPWDHGHYNSECFLDVWILRENRIYCRSRLIALKHADCRDQVYLCTLRRAHPLVSFLKHGDKIRVAARSEFPAWAITVRRSAVCVVHEDGVIAVNSALLNVEQSREQRAQFEGLEVKDNPQCPEGRIVPSRPSVPVEEPGSFLVVPLYFSHTFDPCWMFPSPGQGVLSFVADAVDDVEVDNISLAISPQKGQVLRRYEICIGTGLSWIRRHVLWDSDSNQSGTVRFFGLQCPLGRNQLWVRLDKVKRLIEVGLGEAGSGDVILEYEDPDFFCDVQYISFSTYDTPVKYSDVSVGALV